MQRLRSKFGRKFSGPEKSKTKLDINVYEVKLKAAGT